MVLEQVLSDQDSEDEVDDDVADFEDRRVYNSLSLSPPPPLSAILSEQTSF